MSSPPNLSSDVLLAMTVAGKPQQEIAEAAGSSVRTVRRWQKHPDNVLAVAAAQRNLEQAAVNTLRDLRSQVFGVLAELLEDGDTKAQISAARLILEQGIAHRAALRNDSHAVLEAWLSRMEREDARRFGGTS